MDHMTLSIEMEEDSSHLTESILNFTLEIVYLLTGESFPSVKCGDRVTITVPHSLKYKRNNDQKILEVINKITELLAGEVPLRCQDVSMEKYFEGQKDVYKDVMMASQPSLTSPDGSSNPERCPQDINQGVCNNAVKEEMKEEDDQAGVVEEFSEGHNDPFKDVMMEPFSSINPPERCSRHLYSQESIQEDHAIPHHHQGEELINIKVEVKEEKVETYVGGDELSTEQFQMNMKSKQNEISQSIDTIGCDVWNTSGRPLILSSDCNLEDFNDITQDSAGVISHTQNLPYYSNTSTDSSDEDESSDESLTDPSSTKGSFISLGQVCTAQKLFPCSICEITFAENKSLLEHQRAEHPLRLWTDCEKCLYYKEKVLVYQKMLRGELPFPCSECGKCFARKAELVIHQRIHTGERPYSCSDCGKSFTRKCVLIDHKRIHTGERPFSCSECEKSFTEKRLLRKHQRIHTGERPYSCSECGKSFASKDNLVKHQRIHTGDRRYSCTECGISFINKGNLVQHQRIHVDERPYSCLECGKSFNKKGNLVNHERIHTGERPYSCTECGKCFIRNIDLVKHQRVHTGERPYSCSVCKKSFIEKKLLRIHQKRHTSEQPHCI